MHEHVRLLAIEYGLGDKRLRKVDVYLGDMSPEEIQRAAFITDHTSEFKSVVASAIYKLISLADRQLILPEMTEHLLARLQNIDLAPWEEKLKDADGKKRSQARTKGVMKRFAATVYEILEPALVVVQDEAIEEVISGISNIKFLYPRNVKKGWRKIGVSPAHGYPASRIHSMFQRDLEHLASKVKKRAKIKGIRGKSWLAEEYPRVAGRFGFTVNEEKREIRMNRKTLIERYG